MASTGVGKSNIDVWGNGMAGAAGFVGPGSDKAAAIFAFFQDHEDDIFYEGQVRESSAMR